MKGKFKFAVSISFEANQQEALGLVTCMRIESRNGSSRYPGYDKKNYDEITEETADTIGIQDIPIHLDSVK